jgi:signal peptide peptidase SppA
MALRDLIPASWRSGATIIPVVRLSGVIGTVTGLPLRTGITFRGVELALAQAFAIKAAPVVALVINSPGGAAAQSHLIYQRIRALAAEKEKRVVAAVEDLAASGGYMIACAADEIIVDVSSIVGSIGVISAGFGFQDLIKRIGIERRVHTAGQSKAMLDPFQPERPEDVARLKAMQEDVHAMFKDLVRSRRPKLGDDPDLFSGAFWSGKRAVELGLADQLGDLRSIMRARYGDEVRFRLIPTERAPWWRRRLGVAGGERDPLLLVDRALALVEERLMWSRFGL